METELKEKGLIMTMNRDFRILILAGFLSVGLLATTAVNAATLNCRAYDLFGTPIGEPVVIARTGEINGIGSVEIDGTSYSTRYEIIGIDRVWLWTGGASGITRFALRINPEGNGAIFNLSAVADSDIAPATERFICEPQ